MKENKNSKTENRNKNIYIVKGLESYKNYSSHIKSTKTPHFLIL